MSALAGAITSAVPSGIANGALSFVPCTVEMSEWESEGAELIGHLEFLKDDGIVLADAEWSLRQCRASSAAAKMLPVSAYRRGVGRCLSSDISVMTWRK